MDSRRRGMGRGSIRSSSMSVASSQMQRRHAHNRPPTTEKSRRCASAVALAMEHRVLRSSRNAPAYLRWWRDLQPNSAPSWLLLPHDSPPLAPPHVSRHARANMPIPTDTVTRSSELPVANVRCSKAPRTVSPNATASAASKFGTTMTNSSPPCRYASPRPWTSFASMCCISGRIVSSTFTSVSFEFSALNSSKSTNKTAIGLPTASRATRIHPRRTTKRSSPACRSSCGNGGRTRRRR
jgi:hypothetical protein